MRLGDHRPYVNPASLIWHAGIIVGVRRAPSVTDTRTFVRMEMDCSVDDVEVIGAQLALLARARIPVARHLCSGCYHGGEAVDTTPNPDAATQIDNWRDALERNGEGVWFCEACRSFTATLTVTCPACGADALVPAPKRELRLLQGAAEPERVG